ncbi:MAG: SPOR domain-containing protein [Rhodobacteraceae bacterium]|nr:SPOR domain-containing protein [Paracoccaceae bacterium]
MVAKILSTAAVAVVLSAAMAQAQAGRTPAEIPPASYAQSQYVDSNGCVFIRAGFNGATTWVPRYGDDRRPMCGFTPSGTSGAAQVAAATPAAPAPVTVRAATTASAAAVPVRTRTAQAAAPSGRSVPWSVPPEQGRARARVAQPAQVYQAQAGALDRRWSFYDQTGPSPCTNYSPHSQLYAVPSPVRPDLPLRCGPQAEHPADALRQQSPNGGRWEPWDGANPYPAPDNNVYMLPPPYAPRWPQPYLQGASARPQQAAPRARVSTMGTTAPIDSRAGRRDATPSGGHMSNGQYVQVGTFGVEANARATISRLQAQGMPVATGRATSGGRQMQVVLAGPFSSRAELSAALGTARALGYSDAYIR